MNDVQERYNSLNILVQHCNIDEYNALNDILNNIDNDIKTHGINNKYGLVESYEAYMSIPIYKHIRDLIYNPKDSIIVDVGCGLGIQQLLFKDCYKYIGLDKDETIKITDNSEFIQGDIVNTLPNLKFESYKNVYGISVLCAMCFDDVAKVMKDKFRKLIIV